MAKDLSPAQIRQAEQAFIRYLHLKREKYTRPRRAILHAVLHYRDHFEVEQLLAYLHQTGQRVAKATIYRALPLLVECGILKQVRFSDTHAHYEHDYASDPHDHMVCRRCGRIIEFSSRRIEALRAQIAAEHNFHDCAHRFQISGLCQACVVACPAATLSEDRRDNSASRSAQRRVRQK